MKLYRFIREWRKNVYKSSDDDGSNERVWRSIRRAVLIRDRFRCQRCSKRSKNGKGLTAHHIIPRNEGGEDYIENLITLCTSCHDFVEVNGLTNEAEIIGSTETEESLKEIKIIESDDWRVRVYGCGHKPKLDPRK